MPLRLAYRRAMTSAMLGARLLAVSYKAEAPCLAAAISPKAMNVSRVGTFLRQLYRRACSDPVAA